VQRRVDDPQTVRKRFFLKLDRLGRREVGPDRARAREWEREQSEANEESQAKSK
jgi:hypothetical protein